MHKPMRVSVIYDLIVGCVLLVLFGYCFELNDRLSGLEHTFGSYQTLGVYMRIANPDTPMCYPEVSPTAVYVLEKKDAAQ